MERGISQLGWLEAREEWQGYKDIITPYGYGGPLVECKEEVRSKLLVCFQEDFGRYCQENRIISEFIRFHPLLNNYIGQTGLMKVEYHRPTVAMCLDMGHETIWESTSGPCRNRVRKAKKSGVCISFAKGEKELNDFFNLYQATMNKVNARKYDFFNRQFFESLSKLPEHTFLLVNAKLDDVTIASAIFLCYNKCMHYHLCGSNPEKLNLAPLNLIIYQAAIYGCDNGYKYLHLGGGHMQKDSLLRFKTGFNPEGIKEFRVGKRIHLPMEYRKLQSLWNKKRSSTIYEPLFFPVYRGI